MIALAKKINKTQTQEICPIRNQVRNSVEQAAMAATTIA
ncbi:hypothetical protein S7335_1313 [Synechococcus sp. PCC 7335]|nr:hypothetical protein S7335_1313 [Synechococcus sp. PCC 7335]